MKSKIDKKINCYSNLKKYINKNLKLNIKTYLRGEF